MIRTIGGGLRQIRVDRLMQLREDDGLTGSYAGPEVGLWEVSSGRAFNLSPFQISIDKRASR